MTLPIDRLAGRLALVPGGRPPVRCERPMVGAAMMRRLAEGRPAALVPELLAAVFTLGATAQRGTARRAVRAAFGLRDDAAMQAREREALRQATLHEHLQRLALDLPARVPVPGLVPDPGWLRNLPQPATPAALQRQLFGLPPASWRQRWRQEGTGWLAKWCRGNTHPVARWFAAVQADAEACAWPCRPLAAEADAAALAAALRADPDFAERPRWQGAPAESGAWTRGDAPARPSAWYRLGARLAEVAALAEGEPPATGALPLGGGEGIAWTTMSRGLLLHWVRLDDPGTDAARTTAYRVLAPTEWNFHPEGAFALALRDGAIAPGRAALAAASLDPCIDVEVLAHA